MAEVFPTKPSQLKRGDRVVIQEDGNEMNVIVVEVSRSACSGRPCTAVWIPYAVALCVFLDAECTVVEVNEVSLFDTEAS